ncbi:MAG: hypothetical protein IPJ20_24055 [Flammeovirgaceae bacterium]|nr:hypothetical protein [Flammeovirgaceae bacterium]
MSAVVAIMAGLSILISCLGLFGLAAITIERKTKEIGVRKVLGATESQITLLLSRNFALLIALAFFDCRVHLPISPCIDGWKASLIELTSTQSSS